MQARKHGVPWPDRVHDQLVAYLRGGLKPCTERRPEASGERAGARAWLAATGSRLVSGIVLGLVVAKITKLLG